MDEMLIQDDHCQKLDKKSEAFEELLNKQTYSRNDIMRAVYVEIFNQSPSPTNQEVQQFAGNHWEQVTSFLQEAFDMDMSTYQDLESKTYKIPVLDAAIIITYSCLLFESNTKRKSAFIKKIQVQEFFHATSSEWKKFNQLFCKVLKNELQSITQLEKEWGESCSKKILCSECEKAFSCEKMLSINKNIRDVETKLNYFLALNDKIDKSKEQAEILLESFFQEMQDMTDKHLQWYKEHSDDISVPKYALTALQYGYEKSLYNFLFECITKFNNLEIENQGYKKYDNPEADIDYENGICQLELNESRLTLYQLESYDDAPKLDCSTMEYEEKLRKLITGYYSFILQKLVFSSMLIIPSHSPLRTNAIEEDEFLKYYHKLFQESFKYAYEKLTTNFQEQLKELKKQI